MLSCFNESMTLNDLKDKKIAFLGLGIENLSLAKFFLTQRIEDIAFLERHKENIEERLVELNKIKKITVVSGVDYLADLNNYHVLFRSPGVPLHLEELKEAKESGVIVTSAIRLFFDWCPAPIIGVTGSKGKGTTATLIYEILKADDKKVFLGGNIGVAPFDFFKEVTPDGLVVLELSSFQLEDFERSPKYAVITNLFAEHLRAADPKNPNYHKSFDEYLQAKNNIIKYQTAKDFTVLNFSNQVTRQLTQETAAQIYYFSSLERVGRGAYIDQEQIKIKVPAGEFFLAGVGEVSLLGRHNWENICAAAITSYLAGASLNAISRVIKGFVGLPHHLEKVGEIDGVAYYNDSTATIPEATILSLAAIAAAKIVILGGSEKNSDFTALIERLKMADIKSIVLLPGAASLRLAGLFRQHGLVFHEAENMAAALSEARKLASSGDAVILSPACASFGIFKNYKDRGEQFRKGVNEMK